MILATADHPLSELQDPFWAAFVVACYAALVLAGVLCFKDSRADEIFEKLPKWRNKVEKRPSLADLMTVLRKEILDKVHFSTGGPELRFEKSTLISSAAA